MDDTLPGGMVALARGMRRRLVEPSRGPVPIHGMTRASP
ncbi:MAG: hypothetical protein AVDCRST_MAG87-2830 [uncultured Thermomicrobiales bacterium]|uniref:Uncharacterized protein n=1 Tax=uncultured Thermomicrobiales bacterium TaxID=1645740 RepID=A0A6J4VD00_9BACT|nr:MAG: hypothetical protein AVDCRST_MAG87-2830 [uncultured Thermomicrobiales bacterium]